MKTLMALVRLGAGVVVLALALALGSAGTTAAVPQTLTCGPKQDKGCVTAGWVARDQECLDGPCGTCVRKMGYICAYQAGPPLEHYSGITEKEDEPEE